MNSLMMLNGVAADTIICIVPEHAHSRLMAPTVMVTVGSIALDLPEPYLICRWLHCRIKSRFRKSRCQPPRGRKVGCSLCNFKSCGCQTEQMPITQAKALALPPSTFPLTDRTKLKSGWPEYIPMGVTYAVATARLLTSCCC